MFINYSKGLYKYKKIGINYTITIKKLNFKKMETLEQIKTLVETLSVDTTKFYGGNKSAGTRARKSAQELKKLLQDLRIEILEERNSN
jgi:CMP-2-keto-3-deoxyoctulosonic acid synthetase